ncbi:putative N-acetylglucosamine-1-phosphotransferase subunits alpha/beta-like [Apostichopus japonicus]|uniref:Putative N-acetylglucosamine-1-phosphotransferase subunits alpha/beta-like n=1 Tax=Stichopus japonicus TaxID=307972 RepID=A0A2G8K9M6_STIJA|nr:putative N-acetylglucosamine-1-phosphotransferase subunits alpha/beta-like [Apostichopus japonicus]
MTITRIAKSLSSITVRFVSNRATYRTAVLEAEDFVVWPGDGRPQIIRKVAITKVVGSALLVDIQQGISGTPVSGSIQSRYSILLVFAGVVLIIVSAFQFGEMTMEWSRDQYSQLFNIYHDNIAGKAFQNRMCLPMPIDAVYTWVNGSDPLLIEDLMKYKHTFETPEDGNKSSSDMCKLDHCLPYNHLVIDGILPKNLSFSILKETYPFFSSALNLFNLSVKTSPDVGVEAPAKEEKVTLIEFKTIEEVNKIVENNPTLEIRGKNFTLSRGFLTTDGTHQKLLKMNNIVMAIGLEKDSTEENVKSKVPEAQREFVDLRIPSSAAILTISKDGDMNTIITEAEKSTVESEIKLVSAFLVWNLEMEFDGDMSPNRFEDNEALRYSLRSLEKHAPWIRNVYIVTNGQIPAWINLDNSRLTLVSHSEIFVNQSHLPSFSSPAIESHLHRIPGLSEKFIYLNDDTMFGKDVWPDDFYSHAGGQKVYLTWPVPNCAEGCPSSWIKDNYCDKACNTSECDWDGGDCTGVDAPGPVGGAAVGGGGDSNLDSLYCSNGCANSWVADKYCDTSCNNVDCGYDAGDCGTTNLGKLYSEKITGPVNITLPKGLQVAFFNVTPIFGKAGSIAEGHYQAGGIVRTATIAQLFKTVHLLLYKNFTETEIVIRVNGKDADGEPAEVSFRVKADTRPVEETAVGLPNKDILESDKTGDGPTERLTNSRRYQSKTGNHRLTKKEKLKLKLRFQRFQKNS